jgi:hypothetical protein
MATIKIIYRDMDPLEDEGLDFKFTEEIEDEDPDDRYH